MTIDPSIAALGANQSDLPSDLKGACKAMEEQFIVTLLSSMRKSALSSQSKGSAAFSKDVAYSMFDNQVAKVSTQGEGMGLWRVMYEQLNPEGDPEAENDSAAADSRRMMRTVGHIIR